MEERSLVVLGLLLQLLLKAVDLLLHPVEELGEELEGTAVLGDQGLGPPDHEGKDVEPEDALLLALLAGGEGRDGGHCQVALLELVPVPLPIRLKQELGEGHMDVLDLVHHLLLHGIGQPGELVEPGLVGGLLPLLQLGEDGGLGKVLGLRHQTVHIVIQARFSRHVKLGFRLRHLEDEVGRLRTWKMK